MNWSYGVVGAIVITVLFDWGWLRAQMLIKSEDENESIPRDDATETAGVSHPVSVQALSQEEMVTISRSKINKACYAMCAFGFAGGLVVMYGIMTVKW